MRSRDRILKSLEAVFREAYARAEERDDRETMESLDLEYQREQLRMEVLLDLRELLVPVVPEPEPGASAPTSLLEKAEALRRITRLR